MASNYEWDINPFQDFLMASIENGADIGNKDIEADIFVAFSSMLEYLIGESSYIEQLDFDIKKRKDKFTIIGKNAISALWLSGIFPENPKKVIDSNEYIIENIKYKFNTKTNKLTYRKIKK